MSLALWNSAFSFGQKGGDRASSAEALVAHPHGDHKGGYTAGSVVYGTMAGPVQSPLASVYKPGARGLDINKALT